MLDGRLCGDCAGSRSSPASPCMPLSTDWASTVPAGDERCFAGVNSHLEVHLLMMRHLGISNNVEWVSWVSYGISRPRKLGSDTSFSPYFSDIPKQCLQLVRFRVAWFTVRSRTRGQRPKTLAMMYAAGSRRSPSRPYFCSPPLQNLIVCERAKM